MGTGATPQAVRAFDRRIIAFMRRHGHLIVRVALGLVFLWFGALKVAGASPVHDLVADTLFWLPPATAVLATGVIEILIGLGLVTGWAIRVTLLLFVIQMLGTFSVFVLHFDAAFQGGHLFYLTLVGEFVVKNLVLLAAGLAVVATIPPVRDDEGVVRMLGRRARGDRQG